MLRENKDDPVEYWIRKFAAMKHGPPSGVVVTTRWKRRWRMHEAVDRGGSRKQAMYRFMSWLQSPAVTHNTGDPVSG